MKINNVKINVIDIDRLVELSFLIFGIEYLQSAYIEFREL